MSQECVTTTQCKRFQDAYSNQVFVNSDVPASTCAFVHGTALHNILFFQVCGALDNKIEPFQNLGT